MAYQVLGGQSGQPESMRKVTRRSSCDQAASQGKSSFGLTRTQEPEEKAGSDSQNSVSPGAEPTHTGFTNHKVVRKALQRLRLSEEKRD